MNRIDEIGPPGRNGRHPGSRCLAFSAPSARRKNASTPTGSRAAVGAKATTTPDGVVRIAWARTDVPVKVDGMPLKPFAGLGSWAAFTKAPHGAMVMGDTVVFQDEVTPAMDAAFAAGLEVTGLHNHFFYDEPKVYFMHIGGTGEPEKLAAGVKAVWDAIKKVRAADAITGGRVRRDSARSRERSTPAAIEEILGHKAQIQDGVVKVTIGREGTMHGVKVGGSMGLTTWAAFTGGNAHAVVDGDFIMTAAEVQPVLRALRKADIHIVALHNHMVGEQPAFYFTHFWGKGPAGTRPGPPVRPGCTEGSRPSERPLTRHETGTDSQNQGETMDRRSQPPCDVSAAWTALTMALLAAVISAEADEPPLERVQTIALKGPVGGLDHLAIDAKRGRLFVANTVNDSLDVVDLKAGKLLKQVPGQGRIRGIDYSPDVDRVFVGNGTGGVCNTFDGENYELIKSVPLGDDADNVRYNPRTQRIYVVHADTELSVIDARDFTRPQPDRTAQGPGGVQTGNGPTADVRQRQGGQVVVIDTEKDEVIGQFPVAPAGGNAAVAIDEPNHRLFIGCRKNPRWSSWTAIPGRSWPACRSPAMSMTSPSTRGGNGSMPLAATGRSR